MPVGDQDHGGVAMPPAVALGGLDQLLDFALRQMLARTQFVVWPTHRRMPLRDLAESNNAAHGQPFVPYDQPPFAVCKSASGPWRSRGSRVRSIRPKVVEGFWPLQNIPEQELPVPFAPLGVGCIPGDGSGASSSLVSAARRRGVVTARGQPGSGPGGSEYCRSTYIQIPIRRLPPGG